MKNSLIKYSLPALLLLSASAVNATTVKEVVQHTLMNNPQVQASMSNDEATKLYVDEAKTGYMPQLDFTAEATRKRTKTDPDNETLANTDALVTGNNMRLDLEQLIFDGGLTNGSIDEAKYKYSSNKFANDTIRNEALLESISAYLNLAKYDERMKLSKDNLETYEGYLKTAKETEEINGEALDRVQSSAKIYLARSNYLDEKSNSKKSESVFEKSVGITPDGKYCRPNVQMSSISNDLGLLVKEAMTQNSDVLEQVENIKEQRSKANQAGAAYYPTIKFKAQAIADKDLLTDNETARVFTGKIELTYNIFSSGADDIAQNREKLFLMESQKTLDTVTKSITDKITSSYVSFQTAQKKIVELERYIVDNKQIVSIYKDQFDSGTRTFIDLLNVEGDLYNSRLSLVNAYYDMYQAYYEIKTYLSTLQNSVMDQNDQACTGAKPVKAVATPAVDSDVTSMMDGTTGSVMGDIEKAFASEIASNDVVVDTEKMMFKINKPTAKNGSVFHEGYNAQIDKFLPKLVNVLANNKEQIAEVKVEGHASSNFTKEESVTGKFLANKELSLKRAEGMIAKTVSLKDKVVQDNVEWINDTFKAYGKSSSETIKNEDGTENSAASKRVEFVIVSK